MINKIKKDSLNSIFFQILNFITSFLVGIYLVKTLSVQNYGVYSILLIISGFINTVINLNIFEYLNIGIKNKRSYDYILFSTVLVFSLVINIFVVILIFITPFYDFLINLFKLETSKMAMNYVLYFSIIYVFYAIFMRYLMFYKKVFLYNIFNYIYMYMWILPFLFLSLTIDNLFLSKLIFLFLLSILLLYVYMKNERKYFLFKIDYTILKKSLKFGMGTVLATLSFFIYSTIDKVMLSYILSNEQVAYYAFSNTPFNIISTAFTSIIALIFIPYMNKFHQKNIIVKKRLYNEIIKLTIIIIVPILVLINLFSEIIIILLGKEEYLFTQESFIYISISIFIYLFLVILKQEIYLTGKLKKLSYILFFAIIINIILDFILINLIAYKGAIIATLITNMFIIGLLFKETNILSISDLKKCFIPVLSISLLFILFDSIVFFKDSYINIIIKIIVCSVLYLLYLQFIYKLKLIKLGDSLDIQK